MSSQVTRLAMLLAAARFTDDEISMMVAALRETPKNLFLNKVNENRKLLQYGNQTKLLPSSTRDVRPVTLSDDVAERIERQLVQEVGLTKSDAARALARVLLQKYSPIAIPPFNTKDGFSYWLNKLANSIPLGEILHAAATIRNSYMQGGDDWIDPRRPKNDK